MAELQEVPVYLFTGFLESGKTEFVNESVLSDPSFVGSENTLLLVCEEGEEEYDAEALKKKKVFVEVVENEIDLSAKILTYLLNKNHCTRVLMEYNGMWLLNSFYNNLPDNWVIYQEFMFADATTFLNYNNNMRQLVVDKLQSCDLAVFNRFTKKMNQMDYHKIVRAVSRRAQIAYEYVDGDIVNDDIQDPLPFDINAPIIEVKDDDFAQWYRDITEEPRKYTGKTLEMKGITMTNSRFDPGVFAFGRRIMTCCVQDIQFLGLPCRYDKAAEIEHKSWVKVKAKIKNEFAREYRGRGPVLYPISVEKGDKPATQEEELVYFN